MVFFIFLSFLYSLVCTLHATLHFNNSKSQSGKRELFSTTPILINTKKDFMVYRSFSLSRNKKLNWKPSSGRSQENEML